MGFLERRAEDAARKTTPNQEDIRYAPRRGSNQPVHDGSARRPKVVPGAAGPVDRTELTVLLGRSVLQAQTQQICREWGLLPRFGAALGSGLSRSYLSPDLGVELAADETGTVTTIFLHFGGDDGFRPYQAEIPGGGGRVAGRTHLWAALGQPARTSDPYRDRYLGDFGPADAWRLPACTMHAQYGLDGETLCRLTLRA
jgi:hypothetical protein